MQNERNQLPSLPAPPYFAVIFTSILAPVNNPEVYAATSARTEELAQQYAGFLGIMSLRQTDGLGVTISYWRDMESILAWKANPEHIDAKAKGIKEWYACYRIEIATVQSAHTYPVAT